MTDTVRYQRDGRVATITYDRPDALNAINAEVRVDLNAAFARFRDDEEAWVGIVTGLVALEVYGLRALPSRKVL